MQELLQAASARRRGAAPGAPAEAAAARSRASSATRPAICLTPTHTTRRGKRLRYYVSNRLISGGPDPAGWRLPAPALETAVTQAIADHLEDRARRHAVLASGDAAAAAAASDRIATLARGIRETGIAIAAPLIRQGGLAPGQLGIDLDDGALAEAAGLPAADLDPTLLRLAQPLTRRRRGVETRIVAGDPIPAPDATLIRALRKARAWAGRLRAGTPLQTLAGREGVSVRYMARIIHLDGLSPRLQDAIVQGRQPVDLTLDKLLRTNPPLDWETQERQLGVPG